MIDLHAHYNLDLVDAGRVEEVVYNGICFSCKWRDFDLVRWRVLPRARHYPA